MRWHPIHTCPRTLGDPFLIYGNGEFQICVWYDGKMRRWALGKLVPPMIGATHWAQLQPPPEDHQRFEADRAAVGANPPVAEFIENPVVIDSSHAPEPHWSRRTSA